MKKNGFAPGEVCWVDCGTDVDKATAFYGALFGWSVEDMGPESGGYRLASTVGGEVAGLGPQQSPGPPTWSVYFRVDDVAKAAELVQSNGGTVLFAPMEVMEAGHMAVFADPVGAAFSVWQPKQHLGFGVVDEPGAYCWAELVTSDVAASKKFYGEVLGYGAKDGGDPAMPYTEFRLDDKSVAGMMPRPAELPAEVPSSWGVYFTVDDADAAIAKVGELGGSTVFGPMDVPSVGRIASCVDTTGATFSVLAPS
jgi:predicted enzyme related to lactoylglutathione lyase